MTPLIVPFPSLELEIVSSLMKCRLCQNYFVVELVEFTKLLWNLLNRYHYCTGPSAVPGKLGSGGAEPPTLGPGIVRDIIHVVGVDF